MQYLLATSKPRDAKAMQSRVRDEGAPLMEGEIDCPESDKSRNIQCADCGLCAGMAVKAKDISIVAISKKKKL